MHEMYSVFLGHYLYLPLICLLHLDGHVGHLLAHLADELDHVLRRQRGRLRRLRQLRVQLQELPESRARQCRKISNCGLDLHMAKFSFLSDTNKPT